MLCHVEWLLLLAAVYLTGALIPVGGLTFKERLTEGAWGSFLMGLFAAPFVAAAVAAVWLLVG